MRRACKPHARGRGGWAAAGSGLTLGGGRPHRAADPFPLRLTGAGLLKSVKARWIAPLLLDRAGGRQDGWVWRSNGGGWLARAYKPRGTASRAASEAAGGGRAAKGGGGWPVSGA